MLTLAQSEPPIPILPESLDAHPWLLNCENGTLDLRTGTLRAHSRDDKLTKLCPVVFDMDAKRDEWERFLHRIFAGNARLIAYMQRVTGMWLTGNVDEQKVHVFYGAGANGKSVYLGATQGILGPDYSMKAPPDLLMAKNSSHPTERADLFGKRLVCCIETNEGQRFNESLVKDLSGGDRQRARRMREDFWEFEPTHKLVVAVNHKPVVRGTDHGIWRRLRLVPFTVTIPEEEQDKALASKLAREYPGILAWAVQGCLEWQKDGLRCPDEVKAATDEYRQEQDVLGEFIRECCVVGANERERAKVLFDAYQKYTGAKTTQTKFGTALTERGFDKAKAHGVVWRLGIGLGDSFDED
jgi:putative DNA primase/helicase